MISKPSHFYLENSTVERVIVTPLKNHNFTKGKELIITIDLDTVKKLRKSWDNIRKLWMKSLLGHE